MRFLITGGTGTLGQVVARDILNISVFPEGGFDTADVSYSNPDAYLNKKFTYLKHEVFCVSRDEQKQRQLGPDIKCYLCDIRDEARLSEVFDIVKPDQVFHFAALKCVDTVEENPIESVKTNIQGTQNIVSQCLKHKSQLVFTSTDKAVNPINVYGQCKAIAEKIVLQSGGVVCRYGNVLGSRGSAIPFFAEKIKKGEIIPITDPRMTRFWINIEDAAEFVLSCADYDRGIHIPPIGAAPLLTVVEAISDILDKRHEINIVGLRPGEKIHEELKPGYSSKKRTLSDEQLEKMIRRAL